MIRSKQVGKILRHVLSLSLAPAAVGCGIDTEEFVPVSCRSAEAPFGLEGLSPPNGFDYIEIRANEGVESSENVIRMSMGTKCGAAADKAACEAKYAAVVAELSPEAGFDLSGCVFCKLRRDVYIVNTGDEFEVLTTPDEVKTWLGPVNTPAEAVLITRLAGYSVSCSDPDEGGVRAAGSGFQVLATKYTAVCDPIERTLYVLDVGANGSVEERESEVIESESGVCIGRRPAGLSHARARGATRAGAYLANVAHLEAASVHAFDVLAAELSHHGAPRSLVVRAGVARRDEVRHARIMRRLAARHGGVFRAPEVTRRAPRSLEDVAMENAAEGCVRETFGALVGMWQARAAKDPAVRRVMARVAEDEARHASLAWAVHEWIRPRLDEAARLRVEQAQRSALEALLAEARAGNAPELVAALGLPDGASGERLAENFAEAVRALAA